MRRFLFAIVPALLMTVLCNCTRDTGTRGNARVTSPKPALHVVHEFHGPMPTGVTVSHDGRIFVNYPRWEDRIRFTVAEIRNGREEPYPDEKSNRGDGPNSLFAVQSVVVDPKNRLWALDTGSENLGPIKGFDWPKLVCIDLDSNRTIKTIRFPQGVITEKTYLNDVRFHLGRGAEGTAFITDSGASNGIIVVDLGSGKSWRRLHDHPTTKAEQDFEAALEGKPIKATVGSDGIAISADGKRLYYCPLSGRSLHSVSVDALADEKMTEEQVAATIHTETRAFASDGLESDTSGNLYLTDWEHNAVVIRRPDGTYRTLRTDERMWWPDTLSVATDGNLYFICNQLHRQAKFHDGKDQRKKPYYLFRIPIDGKPVMLRK